MVERQFELLRKERMKGIEEQKTKVEENGTLNVAEPPQAPVAQSTNEENTQQQEVFDLEKRLLVSLFHFVVMDFCELLWWQK